MPTFTFETYAVNDEPASGSNNGQAYTPSQVVFDKMSGGSNGDNRVSHDWTSRRYNNGYFTKRVDFGKLREMRRDPTISLARQTAVAPIVGASWAIEVADTDVEGVADDYAYADLVDRAKLYAKNYLLPLRDAYVREAMFGEVDFGWRAFEIVYTPVHDKHLGLVVVPTKLKSLLNDTTWQLVNKQGNFVGFIHQEPNNNQWYKIDAAHSLFANFDDDGIGAYNEPRLHRAEGPYDDWNTANEAAKRFDAKIAGAVWAIHYPEGYSLYRGVKTDNLEIAKLVSADIRASGVLLLPNKLQAEAQRQLDEIGGTGWKIELMESPSKATEFATRLQYLDKLKSRALGVLERAMMEGQYGTKAEADSHLNTMLVEFDLQHKQLTELFNAKVVEPSLGTNFGEAKLVKFAAQPLSDENRTLFEQLLTALIGNPETSSRIAVGEVLDALNIPQKSEQEIQEEKDVAAMQQQFAQQQSVMAMQRLQGNAQPQQLQLSSAHEGCGAGSDGGKGFVEGNTCGAKSSDKSVIQTLESFYAAQITDYAADSKMGYAALVAKYGEDNVYAAYFAKRSKAEKEWRNQVQIKMAKGLLTMEEAKKLGYANVSGVKLEPLPEKLYHVTTAADLVRSNGLKTRDELRQSEGLGLGGGDSDTVSFTTDAKAAQNLLNTMKEAHDFATGKKSWQDLVQESKTGSKGSKPFYDNLRSSFTQEEWDGFSSYTPEEKFRYGFKRFLTSRETAGGPEDPLFFANDIDAFAKIGKDQIQVLEFAPKPNAVGVRMNALSEFRSWTGDNVVIQKAKNLELSSSENCGTGKGGFKPGNQCAKGSDGAVSSKLDTHESLVQAYKDAMANRQAALNELQDLRNRLGYNTDAYKSLLTNNSEQAVEIRKRQENDDGITAAEKKFTDADIAAGAAKAKLDAYVEPTQFADEQSLSDDNRARYQEQAKIVQELEEKVAESKDEARILADAELAAALVKLSDIEHGTEHIRGDGNFIDVEKRIDEIVSDKFVKETGKEAEISMKKDIFSYASDVKGARDFARNAWLRATGKDLQDPGVATEYDSLDDAVKYDYLFNDSVKGENYVAQMIVQRVKSGDKPYDTQPPSQWLPFSKVAISEGKIELDDKVMQAEVFSFAVSNGVIEDSEEFANESPADAFMLLTETDKQKAIKVYDQFSGTNAEMQQSYGSSSDSSKNYTRTQAVARHIQDVRSEEIAEQRGINLGTLDIVKSQVWGAWKNDSGSTWGKMLQVACSEELGSVGREEFTNSQKGRAELLASVGHRIEFGKKHTPGELLEATKAYVRGTWESSQYILKKAGINKFTTWRGIIVDNDKVGDDVVNKDGHELIRNHNVWRNGAQSTSTMPSVANTWQGAGGVNYDNGKTNQRVVLRIEADAKSVLSLPVHGVNLENEQEVVLTGSHWAKVETYLTEAPIESY